MKHDREKAFQTLIEEEEYRKEHSKTPLFVKMELKHKDLEDSEIEKRKK